MDIFRAHDLLHADDPRTNVTPGVPLLPEGVTVNVNYPAIDGCMNPSDYKWVFSRNLANIGQEDIRMCESTVLPTEKDIIAAGGCFISVSVLKATTKANANAELQAAVYRQLNKLPFTCLASS